MGLFKAISSAVQSQLSDQWLEFFTCDALDANTVIKRAIKTTKGGNNKGSDGVISNGSGIAVNAGQAMAIVCNGKVMEFTAEPGTYTFNQSDEPSVFAGNLGKSLLDSGKSMVERFKRGGEVAKDHRVYFFNTKELVGLKFGTSEPLLYDDPKYQSIGVRCFGAVSLKLENPIVFFEHVAGNIKDVYTLDSLWEEQLMQEFVTYLGQGIAILAAEGVKFSQIPQKQLELVKKMNEILDGDWRQARGLVIASTAIPSISLDPKFQDKVNKYDDIQMMSNPTHAAANLAAAQADAMRGAASNPGGAMTGFMGLNMAQQAGGMNQNNLFAMGQQQQQQQTPVAASPAPAAPSGQQSGMSVKEQLMATVSGDKPWFCSECGAPSTGKFCSSCGVKKA